MACARGSVICLGGVLGGVLNVERVLNRSHGMCCLLSNTVLSYPQLPRNEIDVKSLFINNY